MLSYNYLKSSGGFIMAPEHITAIVVALITVCIPIIASVTLRRKKNERLGELNRQKRIINDCITLLLIEKEHGVIHIENGCNSSLKNTVRNTVNFTSGNQLSVYCYPKRLERYLEKVDAEIQKLS